MENVAALLGRGIGRVLGDLAECGYDAEWACIGASDVGAPHRRKRIWIVGDARSTTSERDAGGFLAEKAGECRSRKLDGNLPFGLEYASEGSRGGMVANADRPGLEEWQSERGDFSKEQSATERDCCVFSDSDSESLGRIAESRGQRGEWATEPDVGRVANGIPSRVDRLRGLGNAVVPQVAEWIGRRIVESNGQG